jgi:hypothetical protein
MLWRSGKLPKQTWEFITYFVPFVFLVSLW